MFSQIEILDCNGSCLLSFAIHSTDMSEIRLFGGERMNRDLFMFHEAWDFAADMLAYVGYGKETPLPIPSDVKVTYLANGVFEINTEES